MPPYHFLYTLVVGLGLLIIILILLQQMVVM